MNVWRGLMQPRNQEVTCRIVLGSTIDLCSPECILNAQQLDNEDITAYIICNFYSNSWVYFIPQISDNAPGCV